MPEEDLLTFSNKKAGIGILFPGYVYKPEVKTNENEKNIEYEAGNSIVRTKFQEVVSKLHEPYPEDSIASLTNLALSGNDVCRILVSEGAIDSLLILGTETLTNVETRTAALRALGSVCCVLEGIERFEVLNGYDKIVDILVDKKRDADERKEAIGIIAQVTSPWINGNASEGVRIYVIDIFVAIEGEFGFL